LKKASRKGKSENNQELPLGLDGGRVEQEFDAKKKESQNVERELDERMFAGYQKRIGFPLKRGRACTSDTRGGSRRTKDRYCKKKKEEGELLPKTKLDRRENISREKKKNRGQEVGKEKKQAIRRKKKKTILCQRNVSKKEAILLGTREKGRFLLISKGKEEGGQRERERSR